MPTLLSQADQRLLAEAQVLRETLRTFVAKVEARFPNLHYLNVGSTYPNEDDGEIGTLARTLGYLSCSDEDLLALEISLSKYPDERPLTKLQTSVIERLREAKLDFLATTTVEHWTRGELYYIDTRVRAPAKLRADFKRGNMDALAR